MFTDAMQFYEKEINKIDNDPKFVEQIKFWEPDVVLLTTPNNPTGKPIKDEDIKKIIRATPNNTIILIDRSCLNVLPEISTKDLLKKFQDLCRKRQVFRVP